MPLRIEPIAGPPLRPIHVEPGGKQLIIGRKSTCDLVMSDPEGAVSREHARLTCEQRPNQAPLWRLFDLQSKHGTYVNGNRLAPETPAPLQEGDRVRIGPWTLRVSMGASATTTRMAATNDDRGSTLAMVKRLPSGVLAPDSQRRLELIMGGATAIGAATSEAQIAELALDALIAGSGMPRAAFLHTVGQGEQVEVIAVKGAGFGGQNNSFSRTLIQAAAEGQTVVLNTTDTPNYGQSVMSLGISAAVCAPIMIDGECDAFLYMDVRGRENTGVQGITNETAAFCQAIARLCGLGLSNLHRVRLERDESARRVELSAARDVQRTIMPPNSGSHGQVSYFMASVPGRFVAGDLFDFFPIDENRSCVLLGDVVGKGMAAGMLMANVQAYLQCLLRETVDPAVALSQVSNRVSEYSRRQAGESSKITLFLSLWAGVFDTAARKLTFVDAGHGYAVMRNPGEPPCDVQCPGGPPLGAVDDYAYTNDSVPFAPGFRLIIFSDGVAEQTSPTGLQFGRERVIDVLKPHRTAADEVKALVDAVRAHAAMPHTEVDSPFADDVTVASIVFE